MERRTRSSSRGRPSKIEADGKWRDQYGHAIDMVPTALDLIGIDPPESIKEVKQDPIEGVSLAATVKDADAADVLTTQYYEVLGSRSMYHDGWRAECGYPGPNYKTGKEHGRKVGDPIHAKDIEELDKMWELYDLKNDPSQRKNLAKQHPDKLKEMIDLYGDTVDHANYRDSFPFTGTVKKVTYDVSGEAIHDAEAVARRLQRRQ